MNLGQRVRVKAVVSFFYEGHKRVYDRTPDCFEAYVTGAANRPLGLYYPAKRYASWDGDDLEPAYLSVTETVKVFRVRKRLFGREYDVHPEDLEPLDQKKILMLVHKDGNLCKGPTVDGGFDTQAWAQTQLVAFDTLGIVRVEELYVS